MGRTKEFDVDQALQKATELFWDQGYASTSMSELQEHMGIGRQSLYDTFGDKHALFLAAMDRYMELSKERLGSTLLSPEASWSHVRQYFDDLVVFLTPAGKRAACLMTNCILEFGRSDADVGKRCTGSERQITLALEAALVRGTEAREIPPLENPAVTATYLMGQVYALSVLAKNGASRAKLRAFVEQSLSTLEA